MTRYFVIPDIRHRTTVYPGLSSTLIYYNLAEYPGTDTTRHLRLLRSCCPGYGMHPTRRPLLAASWPLHAMSCAVVAAEAISGPFRAD